MSQTQGPVKLPAEIHDGGWKRTEVSIDGRTIGFGNVSIPLREIRDIELITFEGKEVLRIRRGDKDFFITFGSKNAQIYRYLAFNLKSDKFAVYFLSPATRGGIVVKDSKWEKGYLAISDEVFWFLSSTRVIRIPVHNIGSVEKDLRTVGDKQRVVLVVTHLEGNEVLTSLVLCPETTLDMLHEYIRNFIDRSKPKEKLSELEEQILTMVYTGVDSVSVESILGIKTEELNRLYDRFVQLGLARVVKIRKEIELTPKGVALVNEIMKKVGR